MTIEKKDIINAIKSEVELAGEVTIKWCDDAEIQQLNHQFRGKDQPTNVLSFPNDDLLPPPVMVGVMSAGEDSMSERAISAQSAASCESQEAFMEEEVPYLGDIAVSLETIAREAKEQGKEEEHHLVHMVIHGVLHLIGYDHINEQDTVDMESIEINILSKLGIDNPYS